MVNEDHLQLLRWGVCPVRYNVVVKNLLTSSNVSGQATLHLLMGYDALSTEGC